MLKSTLLCATGLATASLMASTVAQAAGGGYCRMGVTGEMYSCWVNGKNTYPVCPLQRFSTPVHDSLVSKNTFAPQFNTTFMVSAEQCLEACNAHEQKYFSQDAKPEWRKIDRCMFYAASTSTSGAINLRR